VQARNSLTALRHGEENTVGNFTFVLVLGTYYPGFVPASHFALIEVTLPLGTLYFRQPWSGMWCAGG